MTIQTGSHDIVVYQGATFSGVYVWKNENGVAVDLTGCSARLQARASIDVADPFLDMNSAGGSPSVGSITLGTTNGTITIALTPAETAALDVVDGVYDLLITHPGGSKSRLFGGALTVSRSVTR